MSLTPSPAGHEPKRQRGHLRVAAILQAGIAVFMEKGYDAATMTEIAARSNTAIGSLYRFFPSKENLADALLMRYAEQALESFTGLQARLADMTLTEVGNALVDSMLALEPQRGFALELVEARGGKEANRAQLRAVMRDGMAKILETKLAHLSRSKIEVKATVVLHLLKRVVSLNEEHPGVRKLLQAEIRELLCLYLAAAGAA